MMIPILITLCLPLSGCLSIPKLCSEYLVRRISLQKCYQTGTIILSSLYVRKGKHREVLCSRRQ